MEYAISVFQRGLKISLYGAVKIVFLRAFRRIQLDCCSMQRATEL